MADKISELTNFTPPIDANIIPIVDTTAGATKGITWASVKAALKTYFDSLATTLTNKTLTAPKINEDVALTPTATELNFVDGVTSAIQIQFTGKQADLAFTKLASGKVTDAGGVTVACGNSGLYVVFTEGWVGITSSKAGLAICSNIAGVYGYVNTILSGVHSGVVTMPTDTSIKIVPYNGDGCQYTILKLSLW